MSELSSKAVVMTIDYTASAELFVPKGKPGARRTTSYCRFRTAAEAIRFAMAIEPMTQPVHTMSID
jgi:hypothetical protein